MHKSIAFVTSLLAFSHGFSLIPPRVTSRVAPLLMTVTTFDFGDNEEGRPTRGVSPQRISQFQKMSQMRQQRLKQETEDTERFMTGDDLHILRKQVLNMREELQTARKLRATDRVDQLERAIIKAQAVDAEFVYLVSMERVESAEKRGRKKEAARFRKEAMKARCAMPQFNLDGLWVGKYGDGFEMINVTYNGDVLIAHKVTGVGNVPQGEVTFQVDLNPKSTTPVLAPIELGKKEAEQWNTKFLSRYAGYGQVSAPGFAHSEWVDGQLILVGEYFSFAWLPIGHQVFFGRPSPELTLKLMRDSQTKEFSDDMTREHLNRCWEETEHVEDEMEVNGIFHNQQDYYDQEGCFE